MGSQNDHGGEGAGASDRDKGPECMVEGRGNWVCCVSSELHAWEDVCEGILRANIGVVGAVGGTEWHATAQEDSGIL